MKISQVLAQKGSEVATLKPDDLVLELLALLAERGIGAVVVSADGRRIDGIVSERDIVRAMAADPDAGRTGGVRPKPVSSLMSTEVVTTTAAASLDDVMQLMTDRRIRHVPVVDDDGVLVGIVSIGDVVKARIATLEEERAALMAYVTQGG